MGMRIDVAYSFHLNQTTTSGRKKLFRTKFKIMEITLMQPQISISKGKRFFEQQLIAEFIWVGKHSQAITEGIANTPKSHKVMVRIKTSYYRNCYNNDIHG